MCSTMPVTALSGPWVWKNFPIWLAMWTNLSGDDDTSGLLNFGFGRDPLRMGEDLEAVGARDGAERDAGRLRHPHRKRRRRRNRDHERRTHGGGLLHHFDRHPAGEQDDT